jgi:glycerol dehydrogenase-like iron-containing ADH family enzyme
MTALRDAGGVRYEGDSVPEVVLVDFDLMWSAPRALVAGGIGDVLSCHTALFDWELGVRAGRDAPWDEDAAARGREYLDDLEVLAPLLLNGDDEGIRGLMECHRDIGWLCHELGHARFEEGSEHFWAYAFEHVTGRTIMHGELVTLGLLRARFCEQVFEALGGVDDLSAPFLVGMLSVVDALVRQPLPDIIQKLALLPEIEAALLRKEGRFGTLEKHWLEFKANTVSGNISVLHGVSA